MKNCRFWLIALLFCFHNASAQSWQRVQLGPDSAHASLIMDGKLFGDTGIAFGSYGSIFYSTDFFQTFSVNTAYYDTNHAFRGIEFVNRDTGYIEADQLQGGFLISMNGGLSWSPPDYGSPAGGEWGNKIRFTHRDTAYAANTLVLYAWRFQPSTLTNASFIAPSGYSLCDEIVQMRVTNDSTVYLLCSNEPYQGIGSFSIFRSVNYGNTWQLTGVTGLGGAGDFYFLDDTTIIAVGDERIAKSTNAGDSFNVVMTGDSLDVVLNVGTNAISFVNYDTGFVAFGQSIYKTYNAGDTWIKTDFAFEPEDSSSAIINFIEASTSQKVIVGIYSGKGIIYKTENGGGVAGITGPAPATAFSLYPNPATGWLKIKLVDNLPTDYTIKICNLLGQTIFTIAPVNNQIDISHLAPGIYLAKLTTGAFSQTAKFVKL